MILPGSLPEGYCYPDSPQVLNVDIVTRIQAFLDQNFPGIWVSNVEPPVNYRDRVWFNTDSTQSYYFISGAWQRKFQWPANDKRAIFYTGDPADVDSLDGGSAGAVGPSTGPLWEIYTDLAGKVPVGAGTLQPSGTVVAWSDTGGTDQHTLTQAELPNVNFQLPVTAGQANGFDADNSQVLGNPANTGLNSLTLQVPSGGSGTPFSTMPPYLVGVWIRRTGRIYVPPPY